MRRMLGFGSDVLGKFVGFCRALWARTRTSTELASLRFFGNRTGYGQFYRLFAAAEHKFGRGYGTADFFQPVEAFVFVFLFEMMTNSSGV